MERAEQLDSPNIDDTSRITILMFSGLLKQWKECSCHEVDLRDVGTVRVLPLLKSRILRLKQVLLELICVIAFG